MRTKTILIISIATNVVLVSTLGYIQSLSIEPKSTPAIIYLINRDDPESVQAAVRAAAIVEEALP